MKKSKSLRLASILLMLCLITTCAVSGTFAKYVTSATVTDTARVAKWGINMTGGVSAFKDVYSTDVDSNDDAKVVAPGTAGTNAYTVTGVPEVDYQITFDYEGLSEVFLNAGTYYYYDAHGEIDATYAPVVVNETVTSSGKYTPVKYTVTITTAAGEVTGGFSAGNLTKKFDTLKDALDAIKGTTITYEANEEAGLTVTIAWEWAFSNTIETPHIQDGADTILGNITAGTSDLNGIPAGDYSTTIAYTLTMTATQLNA
ncbi:MAG: hypothetical protein IJW13_01560 [Clostridia bacterium]|nr:hypothetical protein [Clostridia bacterium]